MEVEFFKECCDMGMDVEFEYNGKMYAVLGWPDDGIVAYEQIEPLEEHIFQTSDGLLDGFIIDGQPLRAVLPFANQWF